MCEANMRCEELLKDADGSAHADGQAAAVADGSADEDENTDGSEVKVREQPQSRVARPQ